MKKLNALLTALALLEIGLVAFGFLVAFLYYITR
jgi:hypothetical protein